MAKRPSQPATPSPAASSPPAGATNPKATPKGTAPSRKAPATNGVEPATSPSPGQTQATPTPSHEEIELRAYQIWVDRGRPEGTDREDWFEAERQLTRR
jgi:hypothetical protein